MQSVKFNKNYTNYFSKLIRRICCCCCFHLFRSADGINEYLASDVHVDGVPTEETVGYMLC